ncbi:MAG: cytochrome c oxidase assembly protein [Proteobacteria bacterium]|nr:cytochrome c oxidase assembly protein [Pseudomonadota bacterium]
MSPDRLRRRNRVVLAGLLAVVGGMVGLAFASVPLYDLFCRATGFGGATRVAASVPAQAGEKIVAVRFNADVNPRLSWSFRPLQKEVRLRVGETALVYYEAVNHADAAVTGISTFNVTPLKAGRYFNKIQCFCFTEQTLKPGERVEMPVSFFVDPAIAADPDTGDVSTITLSYTFFRSLDDVPVLGGRSDEVAHVGE